MTSIDITRNICENTKTFSSFDELLELVTHQHGGEYKSSTFARKYVKEKNGGILQESVETFTKQKPDILKDK